MKKISGALNQGICYLKLGSICYPAVKAVSGYLLPFPYIIFFFLILENLQNLGVFHPIPRFRAITLKTDITSHFKFSPRLNFHCYDGRLFLLFGRTEPDTEVFLWWVWWGKNRLNGFDGQLNIPFILADPAFKAFDSESKCFVVN